MAALTYDVRFFVLSSLKVGREKCGQNWPSTFVAINTLLDKSSFDTHRFIRCVAQWAEAGRVLRKQVPSPPPDSLLLGHAASMQSSRHHRWLCDMTRLLGDKFYLRLAHNHVIFQELARRPLEVLEIP
jgi:hypothetical protein